MDKLQGRNKNNWGNLSWKVENLSQQTVFLDLSIQIKDFRIQIKTFQKVMNLYLYIPPSGLQPQK
jgi:hypothetical protein